VCAMALSAAACSINVGLPRNPVVALAKPGTPIANGLTSCRACRCHQ
jgi:hypothetical protein